MPRKKGGAGKHDEQAMVTVKTTLSDYMMAKTPHAAHAKTMLNLMAVEVSKLRVLVSLVTQHHILSLLETNQELPFLIEQDYYSRVFTLIRTGKINKKNGKNLPYLPQLKAAVAAVLQANHHINYKPNRNLKDLGTAMSQV